MTESFAQLLEEDDAKMVASLLVLVAPTLEKRAKIPEDERNDHFRYRVGNGSIHYGVSDFPSTVEINIKYQGVFEGTLVAVFETTTRLVMSPNGQVGHAERNFDEEPCYRSKEFCFFLRPEHTEITWYTEPYSGGDDIMSAWWAQVKHKVIAARLRG